MSLNKLVGGDCGGNNALVQLSNIVSRDAPQTLSQADRFVNEFMAQNSQTPQTFNMNALLNNLPDKSGQKLSQPVQNTTVTPQASKPWMAGPSTGYHPPQMMMHNMLMSRQLQPLSMAPQTSNVQIQYINESELETRNDDVKAKAQEYVNNVKEDDELAYNQFMSFMKKISAGDINLGETQENAQETQTFKTRDEILAEMTEKYKDEWAKLSDVSDHWKPIDSSAEKYDFTESNVMLENKNALDIGKEKLKMGDIPGAVLCFEAAVQQDDKSAEAWFLLGMTQAENEQDPAAIVALKKSLHIDPHQLEAYLTLAAAYTNENMPKYALTSLLNWLKVSPKYGNMLPEDIVKDSFNNMDIKELEAHVKSLFLKAAQLNPSEIDPDVQNALGVVFNISQEYDKAVDCFKTALMVDSDNAKLWNRLGATLANSDRSEEAVDAYHQALNLEPGFIRARYNVGITCMNLGAHKQAAEHFLVALNQQYKAKEMFPEASATDFSSSTIWTTLRMVVAFMGDFDNTKLVDKRNLKELNKAFEIE